MTDVERERNAGGEEEQTERRSLKNRGTRRKVSDRASQTDSAADAQACYPPNQRYTAGSQSPADVQRKEPFLGNEFAPCTHALAPNTYKENPHRSNLKCHKHAYQQKFKSNIQIRAVALEVCLFICCVRDK